MYSCPYVCHNKQVKHCNSSNKSACFNGSILILTTVFYSCESYLLSYSRVKLALLTLCAMGGFWCSLVLPLFPDIKGKYQLL